MLMGKRLVAIIPARGGSKGIPRKNIKNISGKPLIAWTINAALKSKYIDRIIVSTDDEEIMNLAVHYGAEVPFLRPTELAKDDSPSSDAVRHTLLKLKEQNEKNYDYLVLLQPTSPLRTERHIDNAIEQLIGDSNNFDSLISVTELEHPLYWSRSISKNNKLENLFEYDNSKFFRRQSFSKVYRLNGAIYIIEVDVFLKENRFETEKTMAYIMNRIESVDIDTEEDFGLAEFYLTHKPDIEMTET